MSAQYALFFPSASMVKKLLNLFCKLVCGLLTSSGCPSLFVLKSTLSRNLEKILQRFLYLNPSHSFINIQLLMSAIPCFPHSIFFEFLYLLVDLKNESKKKTKQKNNHLTLFFNICRFVLLFPTFPQQKGLSNSFRIRRA